MGDDWVHLRLCMTCGHVGCCDASKNKHATNIFTLSGILSCDPLSRGKIGAGVTWTRL
ncbi:MAG: monovalent cation:H+ antiporter-2, family [Acidobacteriaceae bacterium]|nr:monovalent cation:H+ antiporter-2, family [Acidobacteriaceae bacterium]